jgi:hypothetical protein
MQTNYNIYQDEGFEGMPYSGIDSTVKTGAAEELIPFGRGIVKGADGNKVALPYTDLATLVFDIDFEASNLINGSVNGVAWAEVPFNTDHDTTAADLAAAIDALDGVSCVLDSADATNRTFLIEARLTDVAVTSVVTGGTNQAVGTPTYSTNDVFRGISVHTHQEEVTTGVTGYESTDAVGYLTKGDLQVSVIGAAAEGARAYVIASGANRGKFSATSTGNIDTQGYFAKTLSGDGLGAVELNNPQVID